MFLTRQLYSLVLGSLGAAGAFALKLKANRQAARVFIIRLEQAQQF